MKHMIIACFIVRTVAARVHADCVNNEYGQIACGIGYVVSPGPPLRILNT